MLSYKRTPFRHRRHHSQVDVSPHITSTFKTKYEVFRPRPLLRGRDNGRPSGRLPDGEEDQVHRGV